MAEEDPWGFDEGGDVDFTAEAPVAEAAAATGDAAGAPAGAADGRPVMDVPSSQDEGNYRKPVTLYKHWVRCVHLLRWCQIIDGVLMAFASTWSPHPSTTGRASCSTTTCTTTGTITTTMS